MKRSTWFYLAIIVAFWGWAYAIVTGLDGVPRVQAAIRFIPNWSAESVWRYNGPRPADDEVLVVYARPADRHPDQAVTITTRLADKNAAPGPDAMTEYEVPASDFFNFGGCAIEPWPAEKELYIGLKTAKPHQVLFWENGDWPSGKFDNKPYTKAPGSSQFLISEKASFSSLDTQIYNRDYWEENQSHYSPLGIGLALRISPIFHITHSLMPILVLCGIIWLKGERVQFIAWWMLQGVLLWRVMSIAFPSQWLWTGFYLDRMPKAWFWFGLFAVQMITLPPLASFWRELSTKFWMQMYRKTPHWLPTGLVVVGSILFTIVAWNFPCRAAYGDALGSLVSSFGERHNPLTSALYHLVRRYHVFIVEPRGFHLGGGEYSVFEPLDSQVAPLFLILFSPLYILVVGFFASAIGRNLKEKILWTIVLLTTKTIVLHFGYYEVYGPAVTFSLFAMALIVKAYRNKTDVILPSAAAFVAYLAHFGAAPLAPLVLSLWYKECRDNGQKLKWFTTRAAGTLIIVSAIMLGTSYTIFKVKYDADYSAISRQLPAFGLEWLKGPSAEAHEPPAMLSWGEAHEKHFYPMNSRRHISQYLNGVLFVAGPLLLWIPLLIILLGWRRLWNPKSLGFIISGLLFAASMFMIYNSYVQPRDWDIYSQFGVFCLVLFAVLCFDLPSKWRPLARWMIFALIAYQVWDSGLWLMYNLTWGPEVANRHLIAF